MVVVLTILQLDFESVASTIGIWDALSPGAQAKLKCYGYDEQKEKDRMKRMQVSVTECNHREKRHLHSRN